MRMDVTFEQADMELQPAFDTIHLVDIGDNRMQTLLDGTIAGEYVSDKITSLRQGALAGCPNLTYVSLPNCTTFNGPRHLSGCSQMTALNLPRLTTITEANQTFADMTNITEINLPSLTTMWGVNATFIRGSKLKKVSMPLLSGTTITTRCFYQCYYLATLILGGDKLNPLGNTNALQDAGTWTSSGLRIYVPDDLVETYKTATNWSVYANKIRPISELEA